VIISRTSKALLGAWKIPMVPPELMVAVAPNGMHYPCWETNFEKP